MTANNGFDHGKEMPFIIKTIRTLDNFFLNVLDVAMLLQTAGSQA